MSYPPIPPVHIIVGGSVLKGWTEFTLSRSKKEMTGNLSVKVFFAYIPTAPVITQFVRGKPVQVYVGGHLAFNGTLDSRGGKGSHNQNRDSKGRFSSGHGAGGGSRSAHIGPNEYTVTLNARGKTKRLIDSSHDHKTGTITGAKTKPVADELVKNFKVQLDWRAPSHDMDKVRFRDGGTVADELFRLGNEFGYYMFEDREGKLRVTDEGGPETGDPIILGENILEFDVQQSEDQSNSEIKVKGQRTKKDIRGKDAVNREKKIKDNWVKDYSPLIIQAYADATDEHLDRRSRFEANNRASESKQCKAKVWHVQSRSGQPWEIGTLHYVEVPPEGIFDVMEVIELTYTVDADKNLNTSLTLAPPPGAASGGGGGLSALAAPLAQMLSIGASRRAQLGIEFRDGQYPDPWTGPDFEDVALSVDTAPTVIGAIEEILEILPPLTLPEGLLK
jgi:prophage tail gpP-like protein